MQLHSIPCAPCKLSPLLAPGQASPAKGPGFSLHAAGGVREGCSQMPSSWEVRHRGEVEAKSVIFRPSKISNKSGMDLGSQRCTPRGLCSAVDPAQPPCPRCWADSSCSEETPTPS